MDHVNLKRADETLPLVRILNYIKSTAPKYYVHELRQSKQGLNTNAEPGETSDCV